MQAFRNIIPQIGNNFIINIKDTAVLSVISVTDLFFEYKSATGALYTYFKSACINPNAADDIAAKVAEGWI